MSIYFRILIFQSLSKIDFSLKKKNTNLVIYRKEIIVNLKQFI